jgi:hypothetical protein
MLNLTQKGVEIFIKKAKNIEPFWNNYDLIIWKKDPSGFSNIKGMFRNNSWGTAETIKVNDDGIWKLSKKYVRHFR